MSRPLRVLLVHPGATWSTADVYDGVLYGLRQQGVIVEPYRLDTRIVASTCGLKALWRVKARQEPDLPKPNRMDIIYHASVGALEMALRQQADVVLIISAMLFHPDVVRMMKRAGLRVVALFTESPYDLEEETRMAQWIDGGWTNERTSLPAFRSVNPRIGYLPHAWHPQKHFVSARSLADVPAHDVVFVGSGFPDRITFFNAIDWSGIDLGLYGHWKGLGLKKQARACVRDTHVDNAYAAALYRRAKVGLNLYRQFMGRGRTARRVVGAESLSPRAYELAACGAFHLSEYRAEVPEVFGDRVPTFITPSEAAALIRDWIGREADRQQIAAALPGCVARHSWVARADVILADLSTLFGISVAA